MSRKRKRAQKKRAGWGRWVRAAVAAGLVLAVLGLSTAAGVFYYFSRDLPDVLNREDFKPPQMTRVYASGGELIAELAKPGGGKRTVVAMERIPDHVKAAFMAAEDADFMKHEGIDYFGLARAFYYAAFYDTGLKGTSTITQQVVKNLILSPKREISRKIREFVLARELERKLTKEDILWLYLNEIHLGHGVNGVEEAARLYFGHSIEKVTLAEAAVLAGMTQSPARHSPINHPESALKRRGFVLRQMRDKGFINVAEHDEASEQKLVVASRTETNPHLGVAPHFSEYVRQDLIERYGEEAVYTAGLRVRTTLDVGKQRAASASLRAALRAYDERHGLYKPTASIKPGAIAAWRKKGSRASLEALEPGRSYEAVVTEINKESARVALGATLEAELLIEPASRVLGEGKKAKTLGEVLKVGSVVRVRSAGLGASGGLAVAFEPGPQGSLVMIEPRSRDVVALVGGYDFNENKYNHATQAKRQTGSTFKPFVYAAALEKKMITPATIFLDTPKTFNMGGNKRYTPKNSDGQSRGEVRIREGIGASRNAVAVRVLDQLGVEPATAFSRRVGVRGEIVDNITMVMGSSSLTNLEMTNAYATFASGGQLARPRFIVRVDRADGGVETFESKPEQVIAPEVAYLITDLLRSVVSGYTDASGARRSGTGAAMDKLGAIPIAGKTGTTNEARDGWFIGYTPRYVAGAWVGYGDNRPLGSKEYGAKVAGPIWLGAMKKAHEGIKQAAFEPPNTGIVTATIDPKTGLLTREGGIVETFLTGTAPTEFAEDSAEATTDFLLEQLGATGQAPVAPPGFD